MSVLQAKRNEAPRHSVDRYRVLFDLIPMAVYSIDATGVIQDFNRVAAELWARAPKVGDTCQRFCGSFRLYRPDGTYLPHEKCPMAQVVNGEILEAHDEEVLIERPDGSRIAVIVNVLPLRGLDGEVVGAINCFYDITDRFRMERGRQRQADALVDLNRRKDEFLAMLGHELRNPLGTIVNAAELLRTRPNRGSVHQRAREIIDRQIKQLTRLVDDLLDVSRVNSGRVHLQLENVAVNDVVERALDACRHFIDRRKHELTVTLPQRPVWLHVDSARIQQVVVNLLDNAAKYTEDGGHIWLTVETVGTDCVLRVRDTGIGIAPDLISHVFDLFTQEDRSLDHAQGGLGIGLALVQRLVEVHHGYVEAHSVLGEGSEFVVTLPISDTVTEHPQVAPTEDEKSASRSLRVLVADENVDAVETLALLITELGHDVRKAYDGANSVTEALDYDPDIMLLDLGLPGLDGYEVATQIRAQSARRDLVLVALTASGQETARQRSLAAGFNHHLTKPADFRQLKQLLATV